MPVLDVVEKFHWFRVYGNDQERSRITEQDDECYALFSTVILTSALI